MRRLIRVTEHTSAEMEMKALRRNLDGRFWKRIILIITLLILIVPVFPAYSNPLHPFWSTFTYEVHEGDIGCPASPACHCSKDLDVDLYISLHGLRFDVESELRASCCGWDARDMDIPVTAEAFIGAIDSNYIRHLYNKYEFLFRPGWEDHVLNREPFRAFAIGHSLLKAAPTFATFNVSQCFGNVCGPFKITAEVGEGGCCEGRYANVSVWFNNYGRWELLRTERFHLFGHCGECGGCFSRDVVSGFFPHLNVNGITYSFAFFYFNVTSNRFLTHEEAMEYCHCNPTTTRISMMLTPCPIYRYGSVAYERKRSWDTDEGHMFRYFYSNITTWGWRWWHHYFRWFLFSNDLVYKDSFVYPSLDDAPVREIDSESVTDHLTFYHKSVGATASASVDEVLFHNEDLPVFIASLNTTEGMERKIVYGPVLRPTILNYTIETVGPKRYHVKLWVDPNIVWENNFTKAKLLVISSFEKERDMDEMIWHSYAGSLFKFTVSDEYELPGHLVENGHGWGCGCHHTYHKVYVFEDTIDLNGRDFSGIALLAYNNLLYSDAIVLFTEPDHKVTPVIKVLDNETSEVIPNATVVIGSPDVRLEGTTDGTGMWQPDHPIDPGLYWVYTYKEGYLPRNETVLIDHSGIYEMKLQRAEGMLTVHVVDNETSGPIDQAYVVTTRESDGMSAFSYTDANGTAYFSSDEGTWLITASKEGYFSSNLTITLTSDNLTSEVTLRLVRNPNATTEITAGVNYNTRVILGGWLSVELPGNLSGTYIIVSKYAKFWNGSTYVTGLQMVYNEVENKTYVDTSGGKGLQFFPLYDLLEHPGEAMSLIGNNVTVELVRTDGYTVRVNARVGTLRFDDVQVSGTTVTGRLVWDDGTEFRPQNEWEFVQVVVAETGDAVIVSPDGTFTIHLSRELSSFTLNVFFKGRGGIESYQVPFSGSYVWKG